MLKNEELKMSEMITINTGDNTTKIVGEKFDIFPIITDKHNPVLRSIPIQKDFVFGPNVDETYFASCMVETCKKSNGLGLSANQCGYEKNMFVMGFGDDFIACYNPRIVECIGGGEKTSSMYEGCLSFPFLVLPIDRPNHIRVKYQDFNGVEHSTTMVGLTAHVFQHKLDHLYGVTFDLLVGPVTLSQAVKKQKKYQSKYNKMNKFLKKGKK